MQPAQAQKHVTHNEALRMLDVAVQLGVEAFDETIPPALAEEGAVYAIGTGATGDWAGHDSHLAIMIDGAWQFHVPQPGWLASLKGTPDVFCWTGAAWEQVGVPEFDNLPGVGVNTTSDSTNRLAVSAPATLLTHEGAGHRLKINKASPADTASLLFQTNWSGRAEMGLTGDDAFSVKLSSDGTNWSEALNVSPGDTVYSSANLLGFVSQSGGMPTGAVMESGSNANGSYIRFADGTQICHLNDLQLTYSWTTVLARTWTFPAGFSSNPVVVGNFNASDLTNDTGITPSKVWSPRLSTIGKFSARLTIGRLHGMPSVFDPSDTCRIYVLAVGRWY